MAMKRDQLVTGTLLVVAAILLFATLRLSGPAERAPDPALATEGRAPRLPRTGAPRRAPAGGPARGAEGQRPLLKGQAPGTPGAAGAPTVPPAAASAQTRRQQALTAWESLVDQVLERKGVPASAQAKPLKEAFDKLDKEDQMDGIQRALNLFPDELFPALYTILLDKGEAPEVLDAIFSDALNRPEELKHPLLQELRKDREHPLYLESARILDVIEPNAE